MGRRPNIIVKKNNPRRKKSILKKCMIKLNSFSSSIKSEIYESKELKQDSKKQRNLEDKHNKSQGTTKHDLPLSSRRPNFKI